MSDTQGVTLTLFRRAGTTPLTGRRQDDAVERLDALAEQPSVAGVAVQSWPAKLAVGEEPGPKDERAEAAFDRLCEWAREAGVRLHPVFGTRTCWDWETGERYEAVVLPIVSLLVERDGELLAAHPHYDDGVRTVADGFDAVAAGRFDAIGRPAAPVETG
ncbi:MAG: HTH domain-containing protein [Haloarculaceae archaeon]